MKFPILIITIILIAPKYAYSNSSLQATEMGVCRDLEMSLMMQFIEEGKALPKTWDDFQEVGLIKKNPSGRDLFKINSINSFSLVPNIPLIKDQAGISHEYRGLRLFLISRQGIDTKSSGVGRCVILVKQGETESKFIRAYSYFIPEETAKIILSQINEFDPMRQPLAFDDKFISENRNTIKGNSLERNPSKTPHLPESGQAEFGSGSVITGANFNIFWVIVFAISIFSLLVFILNRRARKR